MYCYKFQPKNRLLLLLAVVSTICTISIAKTTGETVPVILPLLPSWKTGFELLEPPQLLETQLSNQNETARVLITPYNINNRNKFTRSIRQEKISNNNNNNTLPQRGYAKVELAFLRSESGFARTTRIGLTVTKGVKASLKFRIRARAIDARTLSASDGPFRATLTGDEKVEYNQLVNKYSGGLNIPFLDYMGGDLTKDHVEQGDMLHRQKQDLVKGRNVTDYNRRAMAARHILEQYTDTVIEVDGVLTATGIQEGPVSVYAFVRIADVQVDTKEELKVVSLDENEIVAATQNGDTRPVHKEEGQAKLRVKKLN